MILLFFIIRLVQLLDHNQKYLKNFNTIFIATSKVQAARVYACRNLGYGKRLKVGLKQKKLIIYILNSFLSILNSVYTLTSPILKECM